jgi:ELWxxDGT repeat protein
MIRQTVLFGHGPSGTGGVWATNGTAAGTHELPGNSGGGDAADFTTLNGEVIYAAGDASGGFDLWETNGTTAGTTEIGGIDDAGISGASSRGLIPSNLTVLSGPLQPAMLLFTGRDASSDIGLWVTNGTAAGTVELGGLGNDGISGIQKGGLDPQNLTVVMFGSHGPVEVLFRGFDESGGPGLFVTEGTVASTHELTGISGASTIHGIGFSDPLVFGQEVLFQGEDTDAALGLWVTHGTATGTTEVGGLSSTGIVGASSSGIDPVDLTLFNGEVIFAGLDVFGLHSLWLTDGTAADTHEIVGIGGAASGGLFSSVFPDFISYNGKVLFQGVDASGNDNLWVTNGTASGTEELTGISGASTGSFLQSDPLPSFAIFNGEVLFSGTDASGNLSLWVTNGTAVGTHELIGGSLDPLNETAVTITVPPPDDFTDNNTSDILFRKEMITSGSPMGRRAVPRS